MPLFCPICENLMVIITTADSFQYQCDKCMTIEQPTDKDTLVHENVTGTNLVIYTSILHNAGRDPVNPKVAKQCNCGYKFSRQVRLGDEMKLINTCIKCNEQWLDGTKDTDFEGAENQEVEKTGKSESLDKKNKKSKTKKKGKAESLESKHESQSLKSKHDESIPKPSNEIMPKLEFSALTLSSPPTNENAYVWFLIKGDRYVPGIITSIYSVKRFNPKADLVVMITDDVPSSVYPELLKYATHLFYVPYLTYKGLFRMQEKMQEKYASWLDSSFTKWNVLALPYKKTFLLDADVVARKPLDEIFDKPTPAGVFAEPMSSKNNNKKTKEYAKAGGTVSEDTANWILNTRDAFGAAASSILLAPDINDYHLFIKSMEEFKPLSLKNETGSDEQAITYFYSVIKKQKWHSLGLKWNTVPWFKKYADKDPYIIHFMSKEKPWEMNVNDWPDLAEWFDMYALAKAYKK